MARHIITGIDVGTSTVRVVVMEPFHKEAAADGPAFSVLGHGVSSAAGLRRGVVVDVPDASRSIRLALDLAEHSAGISLRHAYIGFGGPGLMSIAVKGAVAVTRADGEISEMDVMRARSAARGALPSLANREILHELVLQYVVDREAGIRQPVGMIGTRLEVQMVFITAFIPHLKNLVRAVEGAGIAVDDVIASPLAAGQAVLSKHQREIGVMHLDLGGGTASAAVYEEGMLFSTQVFPVGSMHVTHDIAIGFQLPVHIAEEIKMAHGVLAREDSPMRREVIRLGDSATGTDTVISRGDLVNIIEARTADIFELVGKYLRKIGRAGLLPAGIVFTGGGAHLLGIVEFARRELRLPCEVGIATSLIDVHDIAKDPSWVTAIGVCMQGNREDHHDSFLKGFSKKTWEQITHFLRPLIP